jgi:cation diffusion facilitator family transporter
MAKSLLRGIRAAQAGLLVNAALMLVKFLAGIAGNSYALIADAVESSTDIFSSLIVWGGLRVAAQPADEEHPYGHGKAESLAAAIVAAMLLGAAVGIAIAAVREIITPHHPPAAFTLVVLAVVVLVKEFLFRKVFGVGQEMHSTAVKADAWHHRSDAITSATAFVGIAVALWGGPGWEAADDWAALLASLIIALNGSLLLRPAINDLMDRVPDDDIVGQVDVTARGVDGVLNTEKLRVRRLGPDYFVDMHVQADPKLSLEVAHKLSGKVKQTIRDAFPAVAEVLIHMEPYHPEAEPPIDLSSDLPATSALAAARGTEVRAGDHSSGLDVERELR